jgi:hypothetical protein
MKKLLSLILILSLMISLFVGCADNESTSDSSIPGSDTADATESESENSTSIEPDPRVDVDLTVMSSTMVFAEVNRIVTDPIGTLGNKIKAEGAFDIFTDEDADQNFYYIIIFDALECCQEGLEMIFPESYTFPEDYPSQDEEIEVIGTLSSHNDYGVEYYYLSVEEINVLQSV